MTVGGDRETHCGQELWIYHQGVSQGAGTWRQGLALQWRYAGGYSRTHVQSSSATGRPVLVPDRGSPRHSENQGQPMMHSCISCMIHSCYPPRKVHENWHPCLDLDILETLTWPHVVSPQGRVSALFCFGKWALLVDPGLDPLQEEKQARSGPCWVSRVYTHQPSAWVPSGALWGWHDPMGPWDDGWRVFVRRRGRGWGPSLCLWLRVWIRKWLWLNFCVMWHGGYPFIFLLYLQYYFYILSSHPPKKRVFLSDTWIFETSIHPCG